MKMTIAAGTPASTSADLLALFVAEGSKGKPEGAQAAEADATLEGLLSEVAAEEEFSGKDSQQLNLHTHGKLGAPRLVLIGLGKGGRGDDRRREALRAAAARAVKAARAAGARTLALGWVIEDADAEAQAVAEGAALGAYRFDKYLREKKPLKLQEIRLLAPKSAQEAIARGARIAAATCLARDLVNEPAGKVTPGALADAARAVAKEHGLKIEVLGRAQISKLGMNLFLGVAQGSVEEPQLVRMTYEPSRGGKAAPLALVGKAITFDSGGLSIKTASGMETMKVDMAGAAAVIAAMALVAQEKPPFAVRGYFGACENMPSGTAYKPGDVIEGKNGLSVEVLNTDAEGRLVLADVLAWAVEDKPAAIVDLATLTGAIMVALGPWIAGLFCNDDAFAAEVQAAAQAAGESVWRMPLPPEMEELIKSPIADLKNTGGRNGGSINAALFLQHFVKPEKGPKIPWAHLDIAGPASIDRERGYNARGGTGAGVRLLAELVRRRAAGR